MDAVLLTFQKELKRRYPIFAGIIDRAYHELGDPWADDASRNIVTMFGPPGDPRWSDAIRGYVYFSLDVLRAQKFFEEHGRYEASSHDELRRDYWENPDFMLGSYLPGIFVSHFLWPQHYLLVRFFRQEALPVVAERRPRHFYEVGVGSGVYSRETLEFLPAITGTGYDISPHSLAFGKRVVDASGVGGRYDVERRDVVQSTPEPTDFLICQEVLEHIEDPQEFVHALHAMVVPGGTAYISAAITSGQSDHLHVFWSPAEARELVTEAGFSILAEHTEEARTTNVQATAPRVTAFLVERR